MDISPIAIVVQRVAHQLLLLGEDIAVAGQDIEALRLVKGSPIGVEVVALLHIPDVGVREELCVLGVTIIDNRVSSHLVGLVAHLHPIHADNIVVVGIDIASLRLQHILATYHHTATRKASDIGLGVELEVVGIERRVAVNDLDDLREDPRLVRVAVVLGSVAVDVGRTLVYQHIAEALNVSLRVAHCTIGRNHRAVMVRCEVAHHDHYLAPVVLHLPALIGLHIDIIALGRRRKRWSLCRLGRLRHCHRQRR